MALYSAPFMSLNLAGRGPRSDLGFPRTDIRSGQEVGFGLSRSSSRDPSEAKLVLMYVLSWGQIWKVGMKHYFGVFGARVRFGDRVFQTFAKTLVFSKS